MEELGRVAYEAYLKAMSGRSLVTGEPLPHWSQLPPENRAGWVAAARAAMKCATDD